MLEVLFYLGLFLVLMGLFFMWENRHLKLANRYFK